MSVPESRDAIVSLAVELWAELGRLTIDQVDGAFFGEICQRENVERIRLEAALPGASPWHADLHLKALFPHLRGSYTEEHWRRPGLRDAVVKSRGDLRGRMASDGQWLASGRQRHQQSWLDVDVLNAEWKGKDVEGAIARYVAGRLAPSPITTVPPHREDEALTFIGLRLDLAHTVRDYWDSDRQAQPQDAMDLDAISREGLHRVRARHEATGDFRQIPPPRGDRSLNEEITNETNAVLREWEDSLPHQEVTWGPRIIVTVPEPVPPEGVIAAFYDAVAIRERGWNVHLLGGVNGQEVTSAIPVWAVGLLHGQGMILKDAMRTVEDALGIEMGTDRNYTKGRNALLRRVPEAREFVMVRTRTRKS